MMDGILEQIAQAGIIGFLAIIIAIITEFIFSIPMSTLLVKSKTPFTKERAKQYALLVLFAFTLYGSIILVVRLNKSILWIVVLPILIFGIIATFFYKRVNSLKEKLYSPNKYCPEPSKTWLYILIVVAMLFFSAYSIICMFGQINDMSNNVYFDILKNIIILLACALSIYIYAIYACSYIITFNSLNNLPRCIIKVRNFESSRGRYKNINCYVISEDDDEITIKPDQSRVISIKKELIIEREYIDDYNGSTKKDGVKLFKWLKKFMKKTGKQVNSPS